MGTTIELSAADGHTFDAFRAAPTGAPKGGLVVIQEIFGVNEHIRAVADDYARAGYLSVAPALFDRVERGVKLGYDADGVSRGRSLRGEIAMAAVEADMAAAMAARSAWLAIAGAARSPGSPCAVWPVSPRQSDTTAPAFMSCAKRGRNVPSCFISVRPTPAFR